ncbi:MAG: IS1634 family transposase, partial [Planctomycetes bacterium]|nr:IS1634 family transposase [Planctomycetota bacterium]
KKPARIEALMMIMTLCLMVYNIGEHELREKLKAEKESIPNQVGKSVNNPTLRWVFQLMQGIVVIPEILSDGVNLLKTAAVTNLTELRQRIIGYFGSRALEIYGMGKAVTDG